MKTLKISAIIAIFCLCFIHSYSQDLTKKAIKVRHITDSIGYSNSAEKIEAFLKKVNEKQGNDLAKVRKNTSINENSSWKVAISPHDDYSYVGYLYPAIFENISSPLVLIFGVCHKAKQFGLENKIIFDSFNSWCAPYGNLAISSLREMLQEKLPKEFYVINDSVQQIEHSVEALIPLLQYYNKNVKIVSILVPYMSFDKMKEISKFLTSTILKYLQKNKLEWGKDFSILISNDAVHYGDEDWGGKNYCRFGTDSAGYKKAINFDKEIIRHCFEGNISLNNIQKFINYTVQEEDFREYKWTWCGRYSIPFGLLTAYQLQELLKIKLINTFIGYSTSIEHPPLKLSDAIGTTAPANLHHWVAYAAIGWK